MLFTQFSLNLSGPFSPWLQAALMGCQQDPLFLDPKAGGDRLLTPPLFPPADLRNQPYRRADAVRRSVRRRVDDQNLRAVNGAELAM